MCVLCVQVTLECSGSDEAPRVDKLVEHILHCSCQSCSKESAQEGALLQLYPSEGALESPSLSDKQTHTDTHSQQRARTRSDALHLDTSEAG